MAGDSLNADSTALEEQLSAYLDGELDDEAARSVERLLSTDPNVRRTLQRMERTWEVLDQLDDSEVDEHFTRSTLEMVAMAAEEDVQRQQEEAPRRRRRRWLVGGATLIAAALAGFLAVALFWPNPNEEVIENLPLLENLDEYRQIEDIEFLEGLYEAGLFVEEGGRGE
jgi:anti-sigma factor RsiW